MKLIVNETIREKISELKFSIIKKSFEDFGISFDIYGRTSDPAHHKMSQDFFLHFFVKKELESSLYVYFKASTKSAFLSFE